VHLAPRAASAPFWQLARPSGGVPYAPMTRLSCPGKDTPAYADEENQVANIQQRRRSNDGYIVEGAEQNIEGHFLAGVIEFASTTMQMPVTRALRRVAPSPSAAADFRLEGVVNAVKS